MDNITNDSLILNDTNETCLRPLLWTQEVVNSRKTATLYLYYCCNSSCNILVSTCFLSICSTKINAMDLCLSFYRHISSFEIFFHLFCHTMSTECDPSATWIFFNCYFEATVDNYFNILEVYILLVLNLCRYVQISYNRDVYRVHTPLLIISHLCIYVIPLFVLLIQFL